MRTDLRLQQLTDWLHQDWPDAGIEVASADASFRRYFRVFHEHRSFIAMDAPPSHEDCAPFVDITHRLRSSQVHAPEILRKDLQQGFLLLEDLGNTPYLEKLDASNADALYGDAFDTLVKLQAADTEGLPEYDESLLLQEMQLMPDWFLKTHLGIHADTQQQKIIDRTLAIISAHVLQQPQVFVHRDYHSRNLMLVEQNPPETLAKNSDITPLSVLNNKTVSSLSPGVIDYQDAVLGPLSYDLVSLLRDCYIAWPRKQVEAWVLQFKTRLIESGSHTDYLKNTKDSTFIQWFDYMGLQRHIKVLGIFARLNHRDGKSNYLDDLPLTLAYFMTVGENYPLIKPLVQLFHEWQIPQKIGRVQIPE